MTPSNLERIIAQRRFVSLPSTHDPAHHAQNASSRLGKFLRIDVNVPDSNTAGYRIPPGNPFPGSLLPEIWSFGLRNPWKFSFDDPAVNVETLPPAYTPLTGPTYEYDRTSGSSVTGRFV